MLDDLRRDARFALRGLLRSPAFAAVAVGTLALGIGVNAAVFTLTNAFLFRGFPSVDANDRVAYIASEGSGCCVSYPDFEDWRAQATSFTDLGVVHGIPITVGDETGFPETYDATEISANTFGLIGGQPILGRDFTPADEVPGAAPVTILSHAFWARRYARDRAILGRTVRLDGRPTTVIGVMDEGFSFPQKQDLWIPLVPTPDVRVRTRRDLWFVFGRLTDGTALDDARGEMQGIGRRLARLHPQDNQNYRPEVLSFNEFFVGPTENVTYAAMWGAVSFVLLIACANLAHLTLARTIGRSRELAVRLALGAGRGRLLRQLLTESVMLSTLGGVAGWWIGARIVRWYALAERGPGILPWRVLDYSLDGRILLYVAAISIGTGVLFGLAPAGGLGALGLGTLQGRNRTPPRRSRRLSGVLVAVEVAAAVVLLAGAGVLVRSVVNVSTADTGIDTERVLTAMIQLPADRYQEADRQRAFFDRLQERIATLPGVEATAIADRLPTWGGRQVAYAIEGQPLAPGGDRPSVPTAAQVIVGPDYVRLLGAAVVAGREFDGRDGPRSQPVVLVNQRFADRHWPDGEAIGKRLRLLDDPAPMPWRTVVGVVSNIIQSDATRQQFDPVVYVTHQQEPALGMWLLARTAGPAGLLAPAVRREVQQLDGDLAVWLGPFTLDQRLAETYHGRALQGRLFLALAALALLLASTGLAAVVAHTVSQRTREIGIRLAIGGTAGHIVGLVCAGSLRPAVVGAVVGLGVSLGVNRVLAASLVHVSPADPLTLMATCAALGIAIAIGCLVPARRALTVDPIVALRHD